MLKYVCFEVLGVPVAKGRAKVANRGKFSTVYSPKKTVDAERSILSQALPHKLPDMPWEGALRIDIILIFPRPKSHYGTGKNINVLKEDAPKYHISRPDSSNILKLTEDSLNGIFFKDDSQICEVNVIKIYGEIAKQIITISKITNKYNSYPETSSYSIWGEK